MKRFKDVKENVSLKEYTTLKVGGICKYFVNVADENELIELLKYIKENNLKYIILGNGSNVILDDRYFDGIVIKLDNLNKISFEDNIITVSAGVMLTKLVRLMLDHNLVSLAFLLMVPGTVGASVVGNAGCYNDEIMNYVKSVKVLDKDLKIKTLLKDDIEFGYRYTSLKNNYIVLEVTFESKIGDSIKVLSELQEKNEKRKETQPLDKKSVGSTFKNPKDNSAGKLIDDLGLKGKTIGGAKVSDKHANFIINDNNATFDDIISLIKEVQKEVKDKCDITLELEPVVYKWDEL